MPVEFFGSQIGGEQEAPLAYTGSPWSLFASDVLLFLRWSPYLINIILPLWPWPSRELDELYPKSLSNIIDIVLHSILFAAQALFLISLPFLSTVPFILYAAYIGAFMALNTAVCKLLNGRIPDEGLKSTEDDQSRAWKRHPEESWIFLNGVAVGKHWLQCNVDRISRTFHRPVTGVHNKTRGIIFDVIQCLIQRSLLYSNSNIRQCHVLIKKALYAPRVKKVVLILHSQGAIEGGMILDWLYDELPHDLLKQLEVYTFGNAANHFNNPYREHVSSVPKSGPEPWQAGHKRAITHMEHYANSKDFVSRWGVLHFTRKIPENRLENRFMGRVFERVGKGHQLNQHYLDNMFPLDSTGRFAREPVSGDFMDMDIILGGEGKNRQAREGLEQSLCATMGNIKAEARLLNVRPKSVQMERHEKQLGTNGSPRTSVYSWEENANTTNLKVKDLSRLWAYRNGQSPPAYHGED